MASTKRPAASPASRDRLRVALMWNGILQAEETLTNPQVVRLGTGPDAVFDLPDGVVPSNELRLIERKGDQYHLVLSEALGGDVWIKDRRTPVRDMLPASSVALAEDDYGMVTVGPLAFFFQRVRPAAKYRGPRLHVDFSLVASVGLAVFLNVGLLVLLFLAQREMAVSDGLELSAEAVRRFMVVPPVEIQRREPERPDPVQEPVKLAERSRAPQRAPRAVPENLPDVAARRLRQLEGRATVNRLMEVLNAEERPSLGSLAAVPTRAEGSVGPSAVSAIAAQLGSMPGISTERPGASRDVGTTGGTAAIAAAGRLEGRSSGPVRARVSIASGLGRVEGSLSRGEVMAVINRAMGRITRCYEAALNRSAAVSGRIVFEWTIQPTGATAGVRQASSTIADPTLSNCIAGVIRGLRFPRPQGGPVSISFPFMFQRAQ